MPLPWCCQGAATVPTFEYTVTVPNLTVLPRYRHGIAPMVLPRYRPSRVLPRYRPSWYCYKVLPRWYCQGTASKVLRRYRYGTAAVSPRSLRPKAQPGTATPTVPLSWYCHGIAPMVLISKYCHGTAPTVLPRQRNPHRATTVLISSDRHGTTPMVPPRYRPYGIATVPLPRYCHGHGSTVPPWYHRGISPTVPPK